MVNNNRAVCCLNYSLIFSEAKAASPDLDEVNAIAEYLRMQLKIYDFSGDRKRRGKAELKINTATQLLLIFTYGRN